MKHPPIQPKSECCAKCKGSGSFHHTVGSHSDDRGGDSDLPCNCTENECFHLATDVRPCECHIPREEEKSKCYSCGGKGTYSQIHDSEELGYVIGPKIHNHPCSACNGTGLNNTQPTPQAESKREHSTKEENIVVDKSTPSPDTEWETKEREAFRNKIKNDGYTHYMLGYVENISDYWLSRLHTIRQESEKEHNAVFVKKINDWEKDVQQKERESTLGKINKTFDSFLLMDWSGESEVYDEIERLKQQLLAHLKQNE